MKRIGSPKERKGKTMKRGKLIAGAALLALAAWLVFVFFIREPETEFDESAATVSMAQIATSPPPAASARPERGSTADYQVTEIGMASPAKTASSAALLPTKIIYTAEIELVAEDMDTARRELLQRMRARRGYVAEMSVSGESGSARQGVWKVRIPVSQYDAFVEDVSRLGEVKSVRTSSEDVGEEFFDTAARVKAKRVEEERLLSHLKRSTAKLTEILAVERELSRVRGKIEQMEGRLRYLSNQTDLTTITLTVHETKGYVPPKPETFGSQVARTFGGSLDALQRVGKGTVLLSVALLPWIVALGVIALLAWPFARRRIHAGGGAVGPAL